MSPHDSKIERSDSPTRWQRGSSHARERHVVVRSLVLAILGGLVLVGMHSAGPGPRRAYGGSFVLQVFAVAVGLYVVGTGVSVLAHLRRAERANGGTRRLGE